MTVLTRFEPFREFATLQDRINRLFRDLSASGRESPLPPHLRPPVDVYEDEHRSRSKSKSPASTRKTSTSASRTTR